MVRRRHPGDEFHRHQASVPARELSEPQGKPAGSSHSCQEAGELISRPMPVLLNRIGGWMGELMGGWIGKWVHGWMDELIDR